MLWGRQVANGGTRIQTQAVGLQSQSQPLNEGLPCARPCSRCFIYLILNHCINARCNGSNDFHFTDEELEALRGRNLSEVKRPKQDLNPGLPKSKAPPSQGPALALGRGVTCMTHFPPGCVTVDWIFASVPVFLRDT